MFAGEELLFLLLFFWWLMFLFFSLSFWQHERVGIYKIQWNHLIAGHSLNIGEPVVKAGDDPQRKAVWCWEGVIIIHQFNGYLSWVHVKRWWMAVIPNPNFAFLNQFLGQLHSICCMVISLLTLSSCVFHHHCTGKLYDVTHPNVIKVFFSLQVPNLWTCTFPSLSLAICGYRYKKVNWCLMIDGGKL